MSQESHAEWWSRALRAGMAACVFLVVVAMFPYTVDPTGDIKNLICAWASLLLLAGWLWSLYAKGLPFRRPQIFLEILALFLLLNLMATLHGAYIGRGLNELGKFWCLFVLLLVASQIYQTPEQIRRLMMVVCIAVAFSSLYALIIQKFGFDPFPWRERTSDEYRNLPGTFGNPNYAAHTLVLAIIMAAYLAARRGRMAYLGFLVLFLVHLRLTQQRAGLIALAAAAALVLVAHFIAKRIRRPVAATVATFVTLALVGVLGAGLIMGASKLRTGSPYPLDLSLLIRYKSYCSAARMILTRPILGYGTAAYVIEYPRFWTPYEQQWFADELKMNAHVHNDLLEIGADAGLPAAGLYLAFLVLGIGYGLLIAFTQSDPSRRRLGLTFAALFCAFLVDGLFGFNLRVPVSAALLFIFAGALEGFWSAHVIPNPKPATGVAARAGTVALIALSVGCVASSSAVFVSQMLLLRGEAETRWKRYDLAEAALSWGERLAPWNWNFARQRGVASLYKNDYPAATEHFERALERNPQYIMTLVPLAHARLSEALASPNPGPGIEKDLDAAAACAEHILDLCGMSPNGEHLLGRVAAARATLLAKTPDPAPNKDAIEKLWREAETHYARAARNGARNASEVYRQLAQARVALGDQAGAEEALTRATQADPSDEANWPYFYNLARNSKNVDRFEQALRWRIQRLQEKKPPDPENLATAYLWLASIEQDGRKDLDAAESAYRNAVSTRPLRPAMWTGYARFAETTGRLEGFRSFLIETTTQTGAGDQQPLPHIAALAAVWTRGPAALVEASGALLAAVHGKTPMPGLRVADLDMGWAITWLVDEVKKGGLKPEDASLTLMHLGMVAATVNELQIADRVFPTAMPNLPADLQSVCAQNWADVLIRLRRASEAVNLLHDMTTRMPDNVDLKLALARTRLKNSDVAGARTEYQALLQAPALTDEQRQKAQAESDALGGK